MKFLKKNNSRWNKIFAILFLLFAIAYDINPVDFVPDVAVVVGWIDDIVITLISIINAYIQWKKGRQ